MQALKETTGGVFPAHTYLLDGSTLIAYIKVGETEPFYFRNGIKGFDQRGRKFDAVSTKPFKQQPKTTVRTVQGSKGGTYMVDDLAKTCTCPGFQFRGTCRHLKEQ